MISRKEAQRLEFEQNKIKMLENAAGLPHYDLSKKEEHKVEIKVDESIGPSLFKADPRIPNLWWANSLTFRAMKKDIFMLDNEMLDIKDEVECTQCSKIIDRQFWKICPYCAKEFK